MQTNNWYLVQNTAMQFSNNRRVQNTPQKNSQLVKKGLLIISVPVWWSWIHVIYCLSVRLSLSFYFVLHVCIVYVYMRHISYTFADFLLHTFSVRRNTIIVIVTSNWLLPTPWIVYLNPSNPSRLRERATHTHSLTSYIIRPVPEQRDTLKHLYSGARPTFTTATIKRCLNTVLFLRTNNRQF